MSIPSWNKGNPGVEAQAIRKGWPEDLSNTFVGEEIEQAALTLNPAQAAAEGAKRERIGGHGALIIDWLDATPFNAVPLSQLADDKATPYTKSR